MTTARGEVVVMSFMVGHKPVATKTKARRRGMEQVKSHALRRDITLCTCQPESRRKPVRLSLHSMARLLTGASTPLVWHVASYTAAERPSELPSGGEVTWNTVGNSGRSRFLLPSLRHPDPRLLSTGDIEYSTLKRE